MLEKSASLPTLNYTASQGARGIQPPLTINDIRSIVVIVRVWIKVTLDRDQAETGVDIAEFTKILESIGKYYLLWSLSPGMQNASLNQSYLESSYPHILDLVAPLSLIHTNDTLNELLICLSSGPWIPDLSRSELWRPAGDIMEVEEAVGEGQLAGAILRILDGTEILTRIRDNPSILQSCRGFQAEKFKAMQIMSTFPSCPQLEIWRREVLVSVLVKANGRDSTRNVGVSKIVALESLAVLSTRCLDMGHTIESAVSSLLLDDEEDKTKVVLASCMGVMACGLSNIRRRKKPSYTYDPTHRIFTPCWICPDCNGGIEESSPENGHAANEPAISLESTFLNAFRRLIPNCVSVESRLALLYGLYRVFCHLDLSTNDLRKLDFGNFVFDQLGDSSDAIRNAAGEIIELLSSRAGSAIVDDLIEKPSLDNNLIGVQEAIEKGFSGHSKTQRVAWLLELCRRIMRHLPEDHSMYSFLLDKMIENAFTEKSRIRSALAFDQVCEEIPVIKMEAGQDHWLESLYSWTGLCQEKFLEVALPELLPRLVILGNVDLIEKVASSVKLKAGALCIREIDYILAVIFMEMPENEIPPLLEFVRTIIVNVEQAPGKTVETLTVIGLTTLSIVGLLCLLCPELGHEDPDKCRRAKTMIEVVRDHAQAQRSMELGSRNSTQEKLSLAMFLRQYILAIVSGLQHQILDSKRLLTLRKKAKVLRSLGALVQLLQPIQSSVLSQIFSPLLIALDTRGLRIHTLRVMRAIILEVDPMQLDVLLAYVVHILAKFYLCSTMQEQAIEIEILDYLILQCQDTLGAALLDVGQLPDLPPFEMMNRTLKAHKEQFTFEQQLRRLINRSDNESAELAEQAVLELREFLLTNESYMLELATTKDSEVESIMGDLIHALLSGIGRFRGMDAPVPRRCVECLGIIGAIDPAKISTRRWISAVPIYTNFNDLEEAKNFACELIEVQLVGKTRSIGDISSKSHWALAVQTLLSFCGITKEVLDVEMPTHAGRALLSQRSSAVSSQSLYTPSPSGSLAKKPRTKTAKDRWRAFPRHVQEVLELLIDAKFQKDNPSAQLEYPCPLYPQVSTFKEWLTRWTHCLIAKVTGEYAVEIFQACKHVVQYGTNICLYILPHLVLNVLIEGSEKYQKEIVDEMAAVLGGGTDWREDGVDQTLGMPRQTSSELNQLASQTVFALFDHITKWIHLRKNSAARNTAGHRGYTTAIDSSQLLTRHQMDIKLNMVQAHLSSISNSVIAMASYRSKAYARSLFHYEQHIRDSRQGLSELALQNMYEKYQEIYVQMDEPDGVEGISGMITSGSLTQKLLQCESAGLWTEANAYYEMGLLNEPGLFDHHAGLYKCQEHLGQFETMLSCVEGDISSYPEWEQQMNEYRVGAAWKAQRWDSLAAALSRPIQSTFETGLGQLLLDIRENRVKDFEDHLQQVRSMLVAPLAAATMDSYSRAYDHVIQLHMLHELEVSFRAWDPTCAMGDGLGSLIGRTLPEGETYVERLRLYQQNLCQRLDCMTPTFRVREQVTRLRRIAFYDIRLPNVASEDDVMYLKDECGRLWLQSAQGARKSGQNQVSFNAMIQAERLENTSAIIERAKWGFLNKSERLAIKAIDTALRLSLASSNGSMNNSSRAAVLIGTRTRQTANSTHRSLQPNITVRGVQDHSIDVNDKGYIRAKVLLLRTRWMEKGSLVSPNEILEGYRHATMECERWEKGYYVLGQYYFRLYEGSKRNRTRTLALTYAAYGCRYYGKALSLGPKYLYQILPRLLTVWLDLGHQAYQAQSNPDAVAYPNLNAEFLNINKFMEGLVEYLPAYMFLSAFPQIISRICHQNKQAFEVLERIIIKVVIVYPDQAIWQMVSVSKSVVAERKLVCNKILERIPVKERNLGETVFKQIKEAMKLCDLLIALCMASVPEKVSKLSLEKNFPKIHTEFQPRYNVMIPCQQTLWPTLPDSSKTMSSHQPFKPDLPKIDGFMDEIEVMSSLQKPRKITILGSDGRQYTYLCKPKDDLRKDAKVMEFNGLVNTLLRKDREANRRNLYIRTYSVVPLNEECGLIEWVHNTIPFRHIYTKQLKNHNVSLMPVIEIKRRLEMDDHQTFFVQELLPRVPKLFYQWLKDISPEPTAWFLNRLRYTRTTAVMSMAGYVLGLGDRHGENLLFDERNGDIVHVDFNCLFEQGKTFPKPERVPFRLTHNMVDAMGLSGYDGVFRLACEQTISVFRDNSESLLSVLEGFLHDPLVEWSKNKRRGQQLQQEALAAGGGISAADDARARLQRSKAATENKAGVEPTRGGLSDADQNEKAQAILALIKRKLNGADNAGPYPLAVKGQVEELIQNAINSDYLSKMYIGWSAYM
ncbi:serine/threonine-protein kinase M1 [Haplosporangium sp. Z 767]|nr:serine/threonine-protein kinase M1 [Haplosporangium sp. Z 767]